MSYQELMEKYQEQLQKYNDLQIEIANLKLENQNLKKVIFGERREYTSKQNETVNGTQSSLFEDVQTEEEIDEQIKENVEEITVHQKKKSKTRKAGIKRSILKDVIIEKEYIDIDEDKKCSRCQSELEKIGKRVVRQTIEYIPAKIKLKEYIQCKALNYASNQEKELSEFIYDGRIPLSNNKVERAIRPFAVARKNWLFSDSVEGAKANAVYYSLIESAKINNLNIYKYITYLLETLPQYDNLNDEGILQHFLPWSKDLPENILNYQGTYKELEIESELVIDK